MLRCKAMADFVLIP